MAQVTNFFGTGQRFFEPRATRTSGVIYYLKNKFLEYFPHSLILYYYFTSVLSVSKNIRHTQ